MAALRGTIRGDRTRANSDARSTRLADRTLAVHADTWRTFAETDLDKDGSGRFELRQNDRQVFVLSWSAETDDISSVTWTAHGRTGETQTSTPDGRSFRPIAEQSR